MFWANEEMQKNIQIHTNEKAMFFPDNIERSLSGWFSCFHGQVRVFKIKEEYIQKIQHHKLVIQCIKQQEAQ